MYFWRILENMSGYYKIVVEFETETEFAPVPTDLSIL